MGSYNQELFEILNDIVYGLKDVKTSGCNVSQIKSAYRAIFGDEYAKNENKEIVASKLNGRMEGLSKFLTERGCCWIDFIGCDSFSNKYRKQIFFATVSRDEEVYENRNLFLSAYSKLLNEKKPVDIFVQLFFVDKEKFIERLNSKSESNRIRKTLDKIQKDGFVIPLSKRFYIECKEKSDDEEPLLVDALECRLPQTDDKQLEKMFYESDKDFSEAINNIIERRTKLRLYSQMELFLRKFSKHQDMPELIKIVTKFNKSLFPSEVNLLYFIPTHCPDETVGLFCYGAKETLSKRELREIKLLSYNILYPYITSYKSAWENEKIIKESIKSAVSAIMSRNMSHNLGSHYLYYTKTYLESRASEEGNVAPDIRGTAKVLGYVQARMDYLATVISNDKYPYGAVNFKSQIYDELTVDDFTHRHFPSESNKRTTNFLLTNLILSENFTRPDVRSDVKDQNLGNKLFLKIKYSQDGEVYNDFTGTWIKKEMRSELETKNDLSSLNIALPGGIMSSHAFFNIIENFIRNSAKYLREDINEEEGLACTIAIRPNPNNANFRDFIIYDNKGNANSIINEKNKDGENNSGETLYSLLLRKLSTLKIVDESNIISKENKGLKEMLFSAIWMRAYNFGNKTYADVIAEINKEKDDKLKLIEEFGFSLVKVVDNTDNKLKIFERGKDSKEKSNLGVLITLPVFNHCQKFSLTGNRDNDINAMLNVMADVIEVDENFHSSKEFRHVFTRTVVDEGGSELQKYSKAIEKRFPDRNKYAIGFEDKQGKLIANSPAEVDGETIPYKKCNSENRIYYKQHMEIGGDPKEYKELAYADSVSGGDFTQTLRDLFKDSVNKNDSEGQLFVLKLKESALTRITIIDERLFNSTKKEKLPWLTLKNIRVLNYYEPQIDNNIDFDLSSIFVGNKFRHNKSYTSDETHFLSIHLGLIEKILKNSSYINNEIDKRLGTKDQFIEKLDDERVMTFMSIIEDFFAGKNKDNLYIAIHSGRGNYSAELDKSLNRYPFISLSALESAFNNSKYQLSQLLYNTVYLGKGIANHKDY